MDPFLTYADNRGLREKVWRTYYNRGDIYFETGKYKLAFSDFVRALFVNPEFPGARSYLERTEQKLRANRVQP